MSKRISALMAAALALFLGGCANKAQTGGLIGAGAGAGLGAIIGHQSGHAGAGALIGGAVGAGGGYIVGNEMDKSDQREREAYERNTRSYRENNYRDSYYAPPRPAVTQGDVVAWSKRGDNDQQIIDRIRTSGARFYLNANDENYLRDSGVSEDVVRYMKDTGR